MEQINDGDSCARPREVTVVEFVKERVRQIAELVQAIDNRILVAGEVTKGPRTAMQRLPRHMRRRAMSYNVKRLPRLQRRFAKSVIAASKHHKKPPSRFWRRRARNLLLNYVRRQRKHVWLETHMWHAKRFCMVEKWGYKMPLCSYQRAFRPSYRDSMRHCVVRDVSFMRCFQIIGTDRAAIINSLSKLCVREVGPTFAFKSALAGRFEVPVLLYEPETYPHGLIAPVRFLWSKDRNNEKHILVIWTHPSSSDNVLTKLVDLLKLKRQGEKLRTVEIDKIPQNIDEWRLRNLEIRMNVYKNDDGVELLNLSDQLVRFRLHGPKSFTVLNDVLAVVEENEMKDLWMKGFMSNNQFWKNICSKHVPGELPDGTVISLLVEDPRLTRPLRKTKPSEPNSCLSKMFDINNLPFPLNDFWDVEIRKQVLERKLTETELQRKRSTLLHPVRISETKIPVLLVVRNSGRGTTDPFTGTDLIVPSGFGLEFWLALQYGTARSIGLKDQKFLELESSRFNFPADVPDSSAGRNELKEEYITLQFSELCRNWLENYDSADTAYVVRDHRILLAIEKWLTGNGSAPEDSVLHSPALVPVSLISSKTGRPTRFAVICAPRDDDFIAVANMQENRNVLRITENPRLKFVTGTQMLEAQNKLEDFISPAKEKLVSLDSIFPDKDLLRKRKRMEKKRKRRGKAKTLKLCAENNHSMDSFIRQPSAQVEGNETIHSIIKYNSSCSRPIIGRVMRGDYSFVHGKGFGIGYCCLAALKLIHRGRVLFRNVSSRYYHPAKITVLRSQLDL